MLFDARLHPAGLSDQDLETLRFFGVESALVPCDASPSGTVKHLRAHFDQLLEVQLPRLERAGIDGWVALGVHPLAVPRRGLPELLQLLPQYLDHPRAVAVGAIGLSKGTGPELEAFTEQLALARRLKLPVLVCTPAVDRQAVTRRTLRVLKSAQIDAGSVLVEGVTPATVKTVLALGHWAGLTLHPDSLTVERAVALVRALGAERLVLLTGAGDGSSDLVGLARAEHLLYKAGLTGAVVARVTGQNAAQFLKTRRAR